MYFQLPSINRCPCYFAISPRLNLELNLRNPICIYPMLAQIVVIVASGGIGGKVEGWMVKFVQEFFLRN